MGMTVRRSALFGLATLLTAASIASAQDKKVGLTMGYPSSFGVVWHVSEKVAIRPELSLAGSSAETTAAGFSSESNSTAIGTGISALFYLNTADKLRTYVSPRFTYSHSTTEQRSSSITNSSAKNTTTSTGGQGSFGARSRREQSLRGLRRAGVGFAHNESNRA